MRVTPVIDPPVAVTFTEGPEREPSEFVGGVSMASLGGEKSIVTGVGGGVTFPVTTTCDNWVLGTVEGSVAPSHELTAYKVKVTGVPFVGIQLAGANVFIPQPNNC